MRPAHETLDWNLLRTFIAIVQEKSISGAAKRLFVTQPAVSLALKRLEAQLGQSLVERNSHVFKVTKAGQIVYQEAIAMHSNIARLSLAVQDARPEISGHIRIITVSGFQSSFFDQALHAFHLKHPLVTCELDVMPSHDVRQAVLHGRTSFGICMVPFPEQGLHSTLLVRQLYRMYCGRNHHLCGKEGLSIEALRHEPYVSFTSAQVSGALSALAIFRKRHGMDGELVGTSNSLEEIKRLVRAGWGIGCLPENTVVDDVAAGRLWPLPPYDGVAQVDLHLVWNPASKFTAAEASALEWLQHSLALVPLEQRLLPAG